MAEPVQAPKFEEHFWGSGNKGFDVLYHNYKAGISASRELNEFLKERITVEDGYVRGLAKLSKNVAAVPGTSLGSLNPLWLALHAMCENLTAAHAQFIQLLQDLSREVSEYHISQKDKMKATLKGEIDDAGDSLRLLETQESALQRAKKLYTQSVEQYVKVQKKMDKGKGDANLKNKPQVENRLKQAENWMETMKADYKMAVEVHTRQFMGFQGNMLEACQKFGSLEEEHLAQMITFVMKMSEAQQNVHILIGKAHQKLNSQMESNSVEKMLCEFVETKGTGKEKPTPEKFRPVTDRALATLVGSSVTEEQRNRSPSVESQQQRAVKPEKSIRQRIRFKKKQKSGAESSGDQNTTNHTVSDPQEAIPVGEVDEEGYSIRPQDAAAIRGFPDDNPEQDSDDSDFEDDFQSKVRQVQIRDPPQDLPKATVDDIRASVQTLRLGTNNNSPSTRIRKATSSQSLNNVLHTPPLERKSHDTSTNSALDPVMSSLLDSDISLSPGMGAVLQPLPLAGLSTDPMEPLRPLAWARESAPPLLPSPLSPPASSSSSFTAPPTSSVSPSLHDPERPVPKPRQASLTKSLQQTGGAELQPSKNSPSELAGEGDVRINVPSAGWGSSSDDEAIVSTTKIPTVAVRGSPSARSDSSPSSSDTQPGIQSVGGGAILSPPLPLNPRKNTRQRGATPEIAASLSPLVQSHTTPTATTPTSPSHSLPGPSPSTTPTSTTMGLKTGIPLAIAFQETCNAIFKSTNPSDCLVKVTGEMVVSFPASLVGQVEKYSQLSFRLREADKLKQVLHNQILLSREGDSYSYSFNTQALSAHLVTMAGKKTAPFYNMQLIKYEVDVGDGSQLPVRLAAYWKCTELITNFRFDYSYIGANLPSGARPPLTQMSVCVPVNGGVRNTLSRPSGNWLADKQQITWNIGEVPPGNSDSVTSIHAKFDVTSGPSLPQPAEVKFVCDGCTLSGVDLDLMGTDYRVSLLKRKFSSGKYAAEMRY